MPRLMKSALLTLLATFTLALFPWLTAAAASLAVHPFLSDDPTLGVAVADELAASFAGLDLLVGPDVAAGAIPPIMASGGFIGLTRVVGQEPMYGPAGAALLRGALGVDVAVTGSVLVLDSTYRLDLVVAGPDGLVGASLQAPHAQRGRLVAQAARVVARVLGTGPEPAPPASPALEGAYLTYVTALEYASEGLVDDAATLLASADAAGLPERALRLGEDLDAALRPGAAEPTRSLTRKLRRALFGLGVAAFDTDATFEAFHALTEDGGTPLAAAWAAVLAASVGDYATATADLATATAAGNYPYGDALAASLDWARGDDAAAQGGLDAVLATPQPQSAAALLGASIVAQMASDTEREGAALDALTRAAPNLVYSFERLSFMAFDADDPLAAAEALAPAVELDPESDLYWTNLGWAYYLLGFEGESEAASLRATELDANQYIALYNLGLVRSVTGRLGEALAAYDRAIAIDPGVDDAAIEDLEGAIQRYPDAYGVSYSLAYLYDAQGRRNDARAQYRRFVRLAGASGNYPEQVAAAAARLVALDAPPPPLELLGGVTPKLGSRGPNAAPYHPGDRVYPSFEVSTPGDQLPARVTAQLSLVDADGTVVATGGGDVVVPTGAVGFVIDTLGLDVPADAAGQFELRVAVSALDGTNAAATTTLDVEGAPVVLRQLLSRGVVMTALASSLPLYGAKDLSQPGALLSTLVAELRAGADAAEAALPKVTSGRFAGQGGGDLFESSTEQDVADYLDYVLASGASDLRFVFVDGYASWALDGAPAAP